MFKKILFAGVLTAMAAASQAASVANTVFMVDVSGSMSGEITWLQNTIESLESGYVAAGVGVGGTNKYGVISYGASNPLPQDETVGLVGVADAKAALALGTSGGFEDGYQAIKFALDNYSFTSGAALNFVLVTDEDRDIGDSSLNYNNILNDLTSNQVILNAVVDHSFFGNAGVRAIGTDGTDSFIADLSGSYTTENVYNPGSGFGSTKADYVDLALAAGGAAWDLEILRSGGLLADSFTDAFIDIKVREVVEQPTGPVVPVPAAVWLFGSAILGFAGFNRFKNKA